MTTKKIQMCSTRIFFNRETWKTIYSFYLRIIKKCKIGGCIYILNFICKFPTSCFLHNPARKHVWCHPFNPTEEGQELKM